MFGVVNLMQNTKRRAMFLVDGHEISATFAEHRSTETINHVKQILLSSFANSAPRRKCTSDILAVHPEQSYHNNGGRHHVP